VGKSKAGCQGAVKCSQTAKCSSIANRVRGEETVRRGTELIISWGERALFLDILSLCAAISVRDDQPRGLLVRVSDY
jgi:hypothetical protein